MSGKIYGALGATAAIPLALVVGIGVGNAGSADAQNVDASCLQATGVGMNAGKGEIIDANQAANAAIIYQTSVEMKLPARASIIAIAASMQEDKLQNSKVADNLDSLGLFQMRPSQGWGTPAQVTDPVYASRKFYSVLVKVANWQSIPLTDAAQAVEKSGDDSLYAQWEPFATNLTNALIAKTAACPSTVDSSGLGGAILAAAQKWIGLPYQYGGGDQNGPSIGQNSRGDGAKGFDCSGLTVWAVYKATGGKILLPRTSQQQWQDKRFVHVSREQLQPGDLVFWPGAGGSPSAPGHVGIYAGNDRFLNAPQTGATVRFDSMAPGTYRHRTFSGGAHITAPGTKPIITNPDGSKAKSPLTGTAGCTARMVAVRNEIDALFGPYPAIGCARPGDPQDHGKGKASDFMVNSGGKMPTSAQEALGDRTANYAIAHWKRLNIKYVIWKQRIWNAGIGNPWRKMNDRGSITENHWDHVHISIK